MKKKRKKKGKGRSGRGTLFEIRAWHAKEIFADLGLRAKGLGLIV